MLIVWFGTECGVVIDATRPSRAAIQIEVYKWVGDPEAQTPGLLNVAPWNVPIGAP